MFASTIIKNSIISVIPFGDQLPGLQPEQPQISKRTEKARKRVAKEMQKAIAEGRLNPAYLKAAAQMESKSKKRLNDYSYQKKQYLLDQMGKTTRIADVLIPGSGIAVTLVTKVGTLTNLCSYADQSPSRQATAKKLGLTLAPTLMGLTSSFWIPPLLPLANTIGSSIAVVSSALIGNAFSYFYEQT